MYGVQMQITVAVYFQLDGMDMPFIRTRGKSKWVGYCVFLLLTNKITSLFSENTRFCQENTEKVLTTGIFHGKMIMGLCILDCSCFSIHVGYCIILRLRMSRGLAP